MPRPGGGHMGHSKHRKKGKTNKGGFTKWRMQMDANAPKLQRPEPVMVNSVKELFAK